MSYTPPPLDLTKPVRLVRGNPARIVCTDMKAYKPEFCILALVTEGSVELAQEFTLSGQAISGYSRQDENDLINVPEQQS